MPWADALAFNESAAAVAAAAANAYYDDSSTIVSCWCADLGVVAATDEPGCDQFVREYVSGTALKYVLVASVTAMNLVLAVAFKVFRYCGDACSSILFAQGVSPPVLVAFARIIETLWHRRV